MGSCDIDVGASSMVPMCLLAQPLKFDLRAGISRSFSRMICNLVLGLLEGFGHVNVGDFWMWVEPLWAWNSATHVLMGMPHDALELGCYGAAFGRPTMRFDILVIGLSRNGGMTKMMNKVFICLSLSGIDSKLPLTTRSWACKLNWLTNNAE
ncbi:hypothetical protein QQP08_016488, partial [Theobroma cacao]